MARYECRATIFPEELKNREHRGCHAEMSVLKAVSVAKSYNGRRVVNGIHLEVKGAEVVGLLGPNGAGKTTTFHMMVGWFSLTRVGFL